MVLKSIAVNANETVSVMHWKYLFARSSSSLWGICHPVLVPLVMGQLDLVRGPSVDVCRTLLEVPMPSGTAAGDSFCVGEESALASGGSSSPEPTDVNLLLLLVMGRGMDRL